MYDLCKEMLDGLGLKEIDGCAVLSRSQVSNIISHSHGRNNRAVLFNLSCAMVVHVTDMLLLEDSRLAQVVSDMHSFSFEKILSANIDGNVCPGPTAMQKFGRPYSTNRIFYTTSVRGSLYDTTTEMMSPDVINVGGKAIRQGVQKHFGNGPNGKHFVNTVLFLCLLLTLGFHVLSGTGHTDFLDAFSFKPNAILQSSNHLKYQELSLFYGFFRGILPSVAEEEIYFKKSGRSVMKLLSFTGNGKDGLDSRGWTRVHSDESLEMLVVRHLKSLSVDFLGHLENSAAWLMQV